MTCKYHSVPVYPHQDSNPGAFAKSQLFLLRPDILKILDTFLAHLKQWKRPLLPPPLVFFFSFCLNFLTQIFTTESKSHVNCGFQSSWREVGYKHRAYLIIYIGTVLFEETCFRILASFSITTGHIGTYLVSSCHCTLFHRLYDSKGHVAPVIWILLNTRFFLFFFKWQYFHGYTLASRCRILCFPFYETT